MDTQNPYERRATDGHREIGRDIGAMITSARESVFAPQTQRHLGAFIGGGLAIEDVDAMAFSARQRGRSEATEQLDRKFEEDLGHARRRAWNDGYGAGQIDGQRAMLRSMDEQYGDEVRAAIENASELLHILEAGDEKVKKGALSVMLAAQTMLLRTLLAAHHNAFVREVSF